MITADQRVLHDIVTLGLDGERVFTLCFACIVPATRGRLRVSAGEPSAQVCDRCGISAESLSRLGLPILAGRSSR